MFRKSDKRHTRPTKQDRDAEFRRRFQEALHQPRIWL